MPLYNQPSDTNVYHENKRRHLNFKKCLIDYLKQQAAEKQSYDKFLTLTYSKLMSEWLRKVDKVKTIDKKFNVSQFFFPIFNLKKKYF